MNSKPWYQSKTVWFNILSGVVGVLTAMTAPNVGLTSQQVGIVLVMISVANVALRTITSQPII